MLEAPETVRVASERLRQHFNGDVATEPRVTSAIRFARHPHQVETEFRRDLLWYQRSTHGHSSLYSSRRVITSCRSVTLLIRNHWEPGYWVERGWNRVAQIHATSVIDTVAVDMNIIGADQRKLVPIGGIARGRARCLKDRGTGR